MKSLLFLIFVYVINLPIHAQKGYSGWVDIGFGSDYNLILYTAHGKFIQPNLFVGLGTGINAPVHNDERDGRSINILILPVFIDARYIPFKSTVSPFLSVQLGGENTFIRPWTHLEDKPEQNSYKLVGIASPSIGLRVPLKKKLALNAKLSAHFRTSSTYNVSRLAYSYSLGIEF